MKSYSKPTIETISFSHKERIAKDCRFCYEGYQDDKCTSQNVCWVDGGVDCVPDDAPYNG